MPVKSVLNSIGDFFIWTNCYNLTQLSQTSVESGYEVVRSLRFKVIIKVLRSLRFKEVRFLGPCGLDRFTTL